MISFEDLKEYLIDHPEEKEDLDIFLNCLSELPRGDEPEPFPEDEFPDL